MVRIKVFTDQYDRSKPIIELVLQFYYNKNKEEAKTAETFLGSTVNILALIVDLCQGTFCNVPPKNKIEKAAKMAMCTTISFKEMEDLEVFKDMLDDIFH